MIDIATVVTILSNCSFVGEFNVPRNASSPYSCLCGTNVAKIDYDNAEMLEIGIENDFGIETYRFNSMCFEKSVASIPTQAANTSDVTMTAEPTQILNISFVDSNLTYKCNENKIYTYLSAFVGILAFLFGLYLQPDLIWESLKRVSEQYFDYIRASSDPNVT